MRALTVRQPYADLIVAGVKTVENRRWVPYSTLPQWWLCECGERRYGEDTWDDPTGTHVRHYHPTRFRSDGMVAQHDGYWWPEPDGIYPFRLAIHAAQKYSQEQADAVWARLDRRQIRGVFDLGGSAHDRLGAILGTVTVTGVHHADDCAEGCFTWECGTTYCSEWAEPDRHHWELSDPTPLNESIPARGQQGLWTVDDDVAARLQAVPA